jgi:hypothetical protein
MNSQRFYGRVSWLANTLAESGIGEASADTERSNSLLGCCHAWRADESFGGKVDGLFIQKLANRVSYA